MLEGHVQSLGDYDVEAELGRGGFGRVLRARHRRTGAVHALKVVDGSAGAEVLLRFRREAEALGRLEGQGVVAIHHVWSEPGRMVLSMDLMPGGPLRARMRGPWPWRDAAALVATLARALARCHASGLVHRDLKPENVLFDEQDRARLADFGCARDLQADSLTRTGQWIGTPAYMAPEQLDGRPVDGRADVWALGVLLFELVEGRRPWAGLNPVSTLAAISSRARPQLTVGPAALDHALGRALAIDPAARPDATALADALEGALAGVTVPRSRTAVIVGALSLGALVAVGLALVRVDSRLPEAVDAPSTAAPRERLAGSSASGPVLVEDLTALARARRSFAHLVADAATHGVESADGDPLAALVALAEERQDPALDDLVVGQALTRGALLAEGPRRALTRGTGALARRARDACAAGDALAAVVSAHHARHDTMQAHAALEVVTRRLGLALRAHPRLEATGAADQVLAPLRPLLRPLVRSSELGLLWTRLPDLLQADAGVTSARLVDGDLAAALDHLAGPRRWDDAALARLEAAGQRSLPADPLLGVTYLYAVLRQREASLGPAAAARRSRDLLAALEDPRARDDEAWRAHLELPLRVHQACFGGVVGVAWSARLEHALRACTLARAANDAEGLPTWSAMMAKALARDGIEPTSRAVTPPPDPTPGEACLTALAWAAMGDPQRARWLLPKVDDDDADATEVAAADDDAVFVLTRRAIRAFARGERGAGGRRSTGE